jgi:hypothetical protein
MRIYNGKNSLLNLPLINNIRLEIHGNTVSREFLPTVAFIKLLVENLTPKDIAIIVSGPFEINMCANVSASEPFIVSSLDEALRRFNVGKTEEEPKVEEKPVEEPTPQSEPEPVPEVKEEEPSTEKEEVKEEPAAEEAPAETPEPVKAPKKRKISKPKANEEV